MLSMIYSLKFNSQKGFAAFYITILIMAVVFGIAVSISILTLSEQKILRNIVKSNQSYYTAEAGIEDILLRLVNDLNWSSSYTLVVENDLTSIEVSDIIGGSRVITSEGNVKDRIKKIQVVYQITAEQVSFYYGAQVGDGGMDMENNSRVKGNVFSNGSVTGIGGRGYIDNTIKVAYNGNKIEGLEIGQDAYAHTCVDSNIGGTLNYVSGGSYGSCTYGAENNLGPSQIDPESLPISQNQIDDWKNDAEAGGIEPLIGGDYEIPIGDIVYLGPAKIEGDLIINNNATLILTGIIWVDNITGGGNITVNNGATIRLDQAIYGSISGVIVADGKINILNGAKLQGSGQEESYLMLLSTNSSLDLNDPAIDVKNTAEGAIFYTNNGLIRLRNNMNIRGATGYKIHLDNGAVIEYESGLENASFTSGPGGGWAVVSWKEIE